MKNKIICSLCLEPIEEDQETEVVNGKSRHKLCSDEFNSMVEELKEIYEEDINTDI